MDVLQALQSATTMAPTPDGGVIESLSLRVAQVVPSAPPGFWEKMWDQGDAFFGAAVVAGFFAFFYLKVVRPDNKAESLARTERSRMELAEAIEKTKQQELNNEMVRVQREIIDTARDLMGRFEGTVTRQEKAVDRQETGITKIESVLDKLHFSPRGKGN